MRQIFMILMLLIIKTQLIKSNKIFNFGLNNAISASVLEDAKLTTNEIITKYGYPSEVHYITTEDGYILCVHRLPNPGGRPYFLQHGLLDSSATWILMGPNSGLGYLLYDLGYDVWMGNVRGNRYSKNHTTISPEQREFWEFSWNEIGIYDIPAIIDYILNVTGHQKLYYTGHSQGTTVFWVMCSKRPEYNEKIILMQALAPVSYESHVRGPLLRPLSNILKDVLVPMKLTEIFPNQGPFSSLCLRNDFIRSICLNIFFQTVGPNPDQLNMTMFPVIVNHIPAGASIKQMLHFSQLIKSGRFCEFDYGEIDNRKLYGKSYPPKYNLSMITAPVVLHYALNDYLTEPIDVDRLYHELGNPIGKYQVPMKEFNHIDFVWGIDVRKLLYKHLIKIMKDFHSGN